MTKTILNTRFDELEYDGLPETLRYEAQNAVIYRKWGDLGEWGEAKTRVLSRIRKHCPKFFNQVLKIFNEA